MENLIVKDFVKETCSKNPTPGGGSVAALMASLGVSLAAMSANLTLNKKGYENVQVEMGKLAKLFEDKSKNYLDFIKKDINAFNELMASYKLKKETEEEKETRSKVIQENVMMALNVPYSLALDLYSILDDIKYCYYNSNKNIQSDALMAMIISRCVILSCLCNVYINLNSLKDSDLKEEINNKCTEMKNKVNELEKELINHSPYFNI